MSACTIQAEASHGRVLRGRPAGLGGGAAPSPTPEAPCKVCNTVIAVAVQLACICLHDASRSDRDVATGATDKSGGATLHNWEVGQPHLPCPRLHSKSTSAVNPRRIQLKTHGKPVLKIPARLWKVSRPPGPPRSPKSMISTSVDSLRNPLDSIRAGGSSCGFSLPSPVRIGHTQERLNSVRCGFGLAT